MQNQHQGNHNRHPASEEEPGESPCGRQEQLDRLVAEVAKLQERIARLEQRLAAGKLGKQAGKIWEAAVRDALRHLDDGAYLAECDLAQMVTALPGSASGEPLSRILTRIIYALNPGSGTTVGSKGGRFFNVLRLTYLEKRRPAEVAEALSIGERQYYRDLKAAIERIVEMLLNGEN